MGKGGSVPDTPAPPVITPTPSPVKETSDDIAAAKLDERLKQKKKKGYASTMLNNEWVEEPKDEIKTTLGQGLVKSQISLDEQIRYLKQECAYSHYFRHSDSQLIQAAINSLETLQRLKGESIYLKGKKGQQEAKDLYGKTGKKTEDCGYHRIQ